MWLLAIPARFWTLSFGVINAELCMVFLRLCLCFDDFGCCGVLFGVIGVFGYLDEGFVMVVFPYVGVRYLRGMRFGVDFWEWSLTYVCWCVT